MTNRIPRRRQVSRSMRKLVAYLIFVPVAVLAAGAFGAVHDQISFSVSSEYFTRFKFFQFQLLDPSVPARLRVAIVGFLGSWWMGIPLGLLSGLAAFIHSNPDRMRRALALSLPVIIAFTLSCALAGLLYGFFETQSIELSRYSDWYIPAGVQDLRHYLCVGYMHHAAYIGGALAVPVAWIFHLAIWFRNGRVA
jgi:hypothetical protein